MQRFKKIDLYRKFEKSLKLRKQIRTCQKPQATQKYDAGCNKLKITASEDSFNHLKNKFGRANVYEPKVCFQVNNLDAMTNYASLRGKKAYGD